MAREAFRQIALQRVDLWPVRNEHVTKIAEGTFSFLNHQLQIGAIDSNGNMTVDWSPESTRLWRFHLQSQEFLLKVAANEGPEFAALLMQSWLSQPDHRHPMKDPDAWHPFCISRRLPVWLCVDAIHDVSSIIGPDFFDSVAGQVQWLHRNMEWDLGGNHLLENLTALYMAGCFLEPVAPLDLRGIERCLLDQLKIQILPSGEHYERTPTYHTLMLVCVLQCVEAARFVKSDAELPLVEIANKMARFLDSITSPDDSIPLLADSVVAETPDLKQLQNWCHRLNIFGTECCKTSDYWVINRPEKHQLLCDLGPLACDHLPAHGHADLFQITASFFGQQGIVDTGNYQYEPGDMRMRCRRTDAHNVLQLGELEHCDIWSSFRMGRRGHPIARHEGETSTTRWVATAHDAFSGPSGRILIAYASQWTILDWYSAADRLQDTVRSPLHWHPSWTLEASQDSATWKADHKNDSYGTITIVGDGSSTAHIVIEEGIYCPDFGELFANQVATLTSKMQQVGWLRWRILLDENAELIDESVEISSDEINIASENENLLQLNIKDGHLLSAQMA
ncbi:heparinase II/III family protein [Stieleria sp. JC731]|uniref:alginate lyase family protein n=1 Tax=Pirellulaceae TaxID=2691357 RepID=UPI001E3E64D6|nr:alginate lyase family protein [Stieleria sp. JC731]MCC9601119.1 heparinase II/III family protein [Stieleria sp. JC731]